MLILEMGVRIWVIVGIFCFGLLLISMFQDMILGKREVITIKRCFIFAILWPYALYLYFTKKINK